MQNSGDELRLDIWRKRPRVYSHEQYAEAFFEGSFWLAILFKGVHALAEAILGLVLLKINLEALNQGILMFANQELLQDPNDLVATHLLWIMHHVSFSGKHFASVYLLSHGAINAVPVIALIRRQLWAYPVMMASLVAFIGYQVYRFSHTHSMLLLALTVLDIFVVALTWREYQRQKTKTPATRTKVFNLDSLVRQD